MVDGRLSDACYQIIWYVLFEKGLVDGRFSDACCQIFWYILYNKHIYIPTYYIYSAIIKMTKSIKNITIIDSNQESIYKMYGLHYYHLFCFVLFCFGLVWFGFFVFLHWWWLYNNFKTSLTKVLHHVSATQADTTT